MKHRFLLHFLSHTVLVVDITAVGAANESAVPAGQEQTVPILRFKSWTDAEQYFLNLEATTEAIASASAWLRKSGTAVLTIV
jgi:lipid A disaccharide synthetase